MSTRLMQYLGQSLAQWEDQARAGRVRSAKTKFDKAMGMDGNEALPPAERALVLYNTAVFYLDHVADGVQARAMSNAAVGHFRQHAELQSDPTVGDLLPFAYENLMLLSLSFDEYDQWADELRRVRPDEGILVDQVPVIHKQRDEGMPWSDMMRMIASSYYRRNDPAADAGLYGRAAGVYQLLLENRRTLRLNREQWSEVLYEYGALMQKLTMVATRAMEQSGRVDPEECRFFLEQARRRIDEFTAANPPNDAVKSLSDSTDKLLAMSSQQEQESGAHRAPSRPIDLETLTPRQFASSCLPPLVIAGIVTLVIGKLLGLW